MSSSSARPQPQQSSWTATSPTRGAATSRSSWRRWRWRAARRATTMATPPTRAPASPPQAGRRARQ
eukprot:2109198-Prymnesium_polylepis.1